MSSNTCGTCRYFGREEPDATEGWCTWGEKSIVPYWIDRAMNMGYDEVDAEDGFDCLCWRQGDQE